MPAGIETWFVQALRVDAAGAVWLWCRGVTDPFELLRDRCRVLVGGQVVPHGWPGTVGVMTTYIARYEDVQVTLAIDVAGRVIRAAFNA